MAVHSIRLGAGNITSATPSTIYTCPAGKRTIVKHVSVANTNAGANRLQLTIVVGGTVVAFMNFIVGVPLSDTEAKHLEVWQVLNAGDVLKAAATNSGVLLVVSGAELTV